MKVTIAPRVVARVVRAGERNYAYDAHSNRIVQLDDVEAEILRMKCLGLADSRIGERLNVVGLGASAGRNMTKFDMDANGLDIFQPVKRRVVDTKFDRINFRQYMANHLRGISLEVTEQCNLRCSYCIYDDKQLQRRRGHSRGRMSTRVGRKAVDLLLRSSTHHEGILAICFYGGEPLLEVPLLRQILEYADARFQDHSREFDCHVTTNGTRLLDPEVREFLVQKDVCLLVSLDGPEHLHDRCRKRADGGGTYGDVIAGLRLLLEEDPAYYGQRVSFNAVYTTAGAILEIVDHFTGLDVYQESRGELRISPANGVPLEKPEVSSRTSTRRWEDVFVANRHEDASPNDGMGSLQRLMHARLAQRNIIPLPKEIQPEGFCVPGGRKLFVGVDGRLTICERMRQFVDIGSVDEGIDADFAADLTESLCRMWQPECSFCIAQRFCGVCLAQVTDGRGMVVPEDFDRVCEGNRRAFDNALTTFIRICDQNPDYFEEMQKVVLS